ncbi:MAG TPA: ATP-dependent 6-phosphofructokinase [Clostridiales bacterium]|nr:ATP-dependent 6-phosphofructokinase [Clostridiales bacterium]
MKLGILCGGGDCPGLNAVIRAVVKTACKQKAEVIGFYDGYKGLIEMHCTVMSPNNVRGILPKGGTILGTTNRDNPFHYPVEKDGETVYEDVSDKVIANGKKLGLDCLIVVGGDGSMAISYELAEKGLPVIGVPKTIDNDLPITDRTFGFETAVNTATDAIDKLHTTAESHHRAMILEVMGRDAGFIALYAGIAGGADVILIPEISFNVRGILKKIESRKKRGRAFSIIVVAEGAKINGEKVVSGENVGNLYNPEKLGGIGNVVAALLKEEGGLETRCIVLGHLQRGGSPAPFDRILSSRYGVAAVRAAFDGRRNVIVCLKNDHIELVPIGEFARVLKKVDPCGELVQTARDLGISFGDDVL